MSLTLLIFIVLALGVAGYVMGRRRVMAQVDGDRRRLHSLIGYYGETVFLFTAVPAFFLLGAWLLVQPVVIDSRVSTLLQPADVPEGGSISLVMSDVRRIAQGLDALVVQNIMTAQEAQALRVDTMDVRALLGQVGIALGSDVQPNILEAAKAYGAMQDHAQLAMSIAVLAVAALGLLLSFRRLSPTFRARNVFESFVKALLIAASMVAVLTTVGIVGSMLFESIHFFQLYPAKDFFFSLTWNPQFRGGSSLGIWPLLWGTLYVSFVALLVAVPVGLLIAIYLSEYASKRLRTFAKPAIEILAGIPTIVYGLFALITVGPLLRDYFAQPLGLGSSSSSVMTAGLVMGIMLIPFVSSLSDDIISAVPQSLRDGSFGLGATQSETIRKVVFPAALPGIVGAILLAASRAIGETMIVVMGAGAAAKLGLNPFEAMTTITVKIVSQLTGDTEFASPETLVAFGLGMMLFFFTLALNVIALIVVRKYREQYE
jgi:phosphate transport system permease protein